MNRKSFFKHLGTGLSVLVAAPALLARKTEPEVPLFFKGQKYKVEFREIEWARLQQIRADCSQMILPSANGFKSLRDLENAERILFDEIFEDRWAIHMEEKNFLLQSFAYTKTLVKGKPHRFVTPLYVKDASICPNIFYQALLVIRDNIKSRETLHQLEVELPEARELPTVPWIEFIKPYTTSVETL